MNKRRFLWILLLLMLLAAAALLYFRADLRFLIKDTVSGWFRERTELVRLDPSSLDLQEKSLSELLSEEGCTYNQSLMLVNGTHKLASDFTAQVSEYQSSGVWMNDCIMDAYAALAADVNARFGEKLYVMSSYRSAQEQAEVSASEDADTAAEVGASEHQTGLALDVYVRYYAGDGFLKSEAGQYVNANCQDYGFIIRYPRGKEDITGIRFEPWHIRYVGMPHAMYIASNGLTLEEYITGLEPDQFYELDGYLVSRQRGGTFYIPAGYTALTVSPDNTGCYILTLRLDGTA